MAEMTRRDQELQGLYELRKNKEALERREKEREEIQRKKAVVDADILREAEGLVKHLSECNAGAYKREIDVKIEEVSKKKRKTAKLLCPFAILVLGALKMIIIKTEWWSATGWLFSNMDVTILYVFLGIFTVALTGLAFFNRLEFPTWLQVGMFILAMPLLGGVILGPILSCWAMIVINPVYVMLPILMIVLVFISLCSGSKRAYTEREKQLLKEKKALDDRNRQINKQNVEEKIPIVTQQKRERIKQLESCHKQCEDEIKILRTKIQNNGWLSGGDIQWTDQVIHYIQSRRADSIKEALRLVDMEQERERQRKLDEQRHKEMMEEIEYQSWEMARMREEQREAAERAEKALRDSEAAAERARYEDEMRRYESEQRIKQELLNLEIERNRR